MPKHCRCCKDMRHIRDSCSERPLENQPYYICDVGDYLSVQCTHITHTEMEASKHSQHAEPTSILTYRAITIPRTAKPRYADHRPVTAIETKFSLSQPSKSSTPFPDTQVSSEEIASDDPPFVHPQDEHQDGDDDTDKASNTLNVPSTPYPPKGQPFNS
ncbi:hypothetical protein G6F46_007416 [Rhizopus delemar]|uniref:Uncharacterized protein n=1 Tax=Rhizopus delemar (strain RA 99-880 / ATCC MYA-4621 / FGSC 9543 / NRRL 43880) TaxID=246409 RepID=I1CKF0_RHIO9|nr:hypothetical protein RO3G_13641 [Rhizopus delemar RA 99-880]KAG1495971.1 hypothetical protein G6F54_006804 [Rhizopus delemar]KAG1559219.1 hypothetical protein G6F49_003800 [Rhizopus delemar]KAG1594399.1 hypothetical protein G6F47_008811 [Rhizopus delemar]KAG1594447.1 hypothetical protein G6F48_001352 [Rhizopus delemar]|eukprot:EIE88930.1 hypothetical protein RO3G_13641 [Rhizopus delemar RA 99-880]